jgi:membrane protein
MAESTPTTRDADPEQAAGPQPQPELREPRQSDPTPTTLSRRDYGAILVRGVREALADHVTNLAAALAYYGFLALPSALLVGLGVFSLIAKPADVTSLLGHLRGVVPESAIGLLNDSLTRTTGAQHGGVVLVVVGALLALWTLTGAMTTLQWALNIAYDREETRGFVKQRLTALAMLVCVVFAVVLVFGLLVLGPHLSGWVGDAVGQRGIVTWVWWIAEWPVLLVALLAAFGAILYLGPNIRPPRWSFVSFGSAFAVVVWLAASGGFAFYASRFASYNKTWGSLSAVIVMLTWLWLSSLALLVGAEINAEAERSRELRRGEPAQEELQAPAG